MELGVRGVRWRSWGSWCGLCVNWQGREALVWKKEEEDGFSHKALSQLALKGGEEGDWKLVLFGGVHSSVEAMYRLKGGECRWLAVTGEASKRCGSCG